MSLGLDRAFPRSGSRRPRSAWTFLRRFPRRAPRRSRVRWARVLSVLGVAGLLLALAGLIAWRLGVDRSPFAGLLPAETPLVLEGEPSAVLEALRRIPGPGPQLIKDFGLSPALLEQTDRMLVALLAGSPVSTPNPCRTHLARTVDKLEDTWNQTGTWPDQLQEIPGCPQGGQVAYHKQGEDYRLECRGADSHLAYDSRQGFLEGPASAPVYLVAIEKAPEQTIQAALVPGSQQDLRLYCSDPGQLDRLLSASGARLELPGPKSPPFRLTAQARTLRELCPTLPAGLLRDERVEVWGDPATGRLSARLPLPTPALPERAAEIPEVLTALPASPVALAGTPGFLALLGLDPGTEDSPDVLGLTLNAPLCRGQEREQLARALEGRQATTLEARFGDPSRARAWLGRSAWASLQGEGHRGGQAAWLQERVVVRTGLGKPDREDRPDLPEAAGEIALAGWATLQVPGAGREVYSFTAGREAERLWLEIARQGTSADSPEPAASPSVPTLQGS